MIAERLTAQLLAGSPARDPLAVVRRLLAVQAQDPRGARLAIRARSEGLFAEDVDRALTDDRSLLITWVNRGTLHLLRTEDYPWLHALTTPRLLTACSRRLSQTGVAPNAAERRLSTIERSLVDEGPLSRAQLGERLTARNVPTDGHALVHLLVLASLRGITVRGPIIAGQHAYVLVRDWLGQPVRVDRDSALTELARRYLEGHGPAGEGDLAKWAGIGLRDARKGLDAIASQLDRRADGLLDLAGRAPAGKLPAPRLLGAFDPLLMGWKSREAILGAHKGVVTVNGIFRPIALVRGRAVATWRIATGKLALEPLTRISRSDTFALERDAIDVVSYLGLGPRAQTADARVQTAGARVQTAGARAQSGRRART